MEKTENIDFVERYGKHQGWDLKPRTVLVEGTTDATLFQLSARLNLQQIGNDLFEGLAIVAAGDGDRGGTRGVIRELITLRNLARTCLSQNGRPIYRFIGLFDNDNAGRLAVKQAQRIDTAVLEYRDIFRLQPVMPTTGNLDPKTLQKTFEKKNVNYKGIDWEIEDLLSEQFFTAFLNDHPDAISRETKRNDKIHRDLTRDGKARLHRFIRDYAIHEDLEAVMRVLQALRFYLSLTP